MYRNEQRITSNIIRTQQPGSLSQNIGSKISSVESKVKSETRCYIENGS